jgi:ADP-ribose pyrophosphatase YjhB (NUDIX family)
MNEKKMDTNTQIRMRFKMIVAVHLLLVEDTKVLLARRYKTGYEDGNYSVPAGHVEENESCIDALVREAKEEIDISIHPSDLSLAHVMHRKTDRESIDFFFICHRYEGIPTIHEPDKCDDIKWVEMAQLPKNTIDYIRQAINCYTLGQDYSQLGI